MENRIQSLWVMRRPERGTKVIITDAENRRVCSVDYATTMSNDEQLLATNTEHASRIVRQCNAHNALVASLELLLGIVESEYEADPEPDDLPSWKEAIETARSVIAKSQSGDVQ